MIRNFTTKKLQKVHFPHNSQKAIFHGFSAQFILETLNSENVQVTPEQKGLEKGHLDV